MSTVPSPTWSELLSARASSRRAGPRANERPDEFALARGAGAGQPQRDTTHEVACFALRAAHRPSVAVSDLRLLPRILAARAEHVAPVPCARPGPAGALCRSLAALVYLCRDGPRPRVLRRRPFQSI